MGAPVFEPAAVPFDAAGLAAAPRASDTLWPLASSTAAADGRLSRCVSMGNPHAVQVVDDVDTRAGARDRAADRAPPALSAAASTPASCRWSTAATSGCACSSAAPAKRWPAAPAPARRWWPASGAACSTRRCASSARGGELSIAWAGDGQPVYLTGPAVTVFEGEIDV